MTSARPGAAIAALLLAVAAGPRAKGDDERDLRPGLVASVRDGRATAQFVAATPHFALAANESLHPRVAPAFTVEWSGLLAVLEGGTYRFAGEGAEIALADRAVGSEPVALAAGYVPLSIHVRRPAGAARLTVSWESEHFALEPLPPAALFHRAAAAPPEDLIARGAEVFAEHGCDACHAAQSALDPNQSPRRGPRLDGLAERLRARWTYHALGDPRAHRASATMPAFPDPAARRDLVAYLFAGGGGQSDAPAAPPRDLHAESVGRELYATVGCAACHDDAALALRGLGSKYVPGGLIAYLLDPLAIHPDGRMPALFLTRDEASALASFLLADRAPGFEGEIPALASADAARGHALFATLGCARCHERTGAPPPAGPAAPPLARLRADAGCLARTPPAGLPHYRLPEAEAAAVVALAEARRRAELHAAPLHALEHAVRTLRCDACHTWNMGSPSTLLRERPPPLSGAGAKLRLPYLEAVLLAKQRARPYLHLRMPHYPGAAVRALPRLLAAATGAAPAANDEAAAPVAELRILAERGRELLGSDAAHGGLACIACHDHGAHRAVADEKGPELAGTATRLRYDWFRRWMLAPSRIVAGTTMPSYFSGVLRAGADAEISRLWAGLVLADELPPPPGAGEVAGASAESMPVPGESAIVQRFILPGATAAAIAVGLPPGPRLPAVSCCFDAARCRLVYAWQGGFLDLRPSLKKAQEYPELLGSVFYRSETFPLRHGERERVPRADFRGYRLVEGLPEFRYSADGLDVRERFAPLSHASGLTREFTVTGATQALWIVVPSYAGVRIETTVGPLVDGALELAPAPRLRFDLRIEREETP